MQGEHTVSSYDKELEALRTAIARMGGLAESQIADAVDALYKRDQEAAQIVVKADKQLDEIEVQLEHDAITILAKRQPMASDLRAIVAALKMSSDIERIGDYAKNIAKRVVAISSGNIRIVRTIVQVFFFCLLVFCLLFQIHLFFVNLHGLELNLGKVR